MDRMIRKVAVLGAGIMGSRLACVFANIGTEVLLLDLANHALTEEDKQKARGENNPEVMNRNVQSALAEAIKSEPSPIFRKDLAIHIKTGNFEADFHRIADYDWIMEAVVENIEIKKEILSKVDDFRKPGTLITTNTSGIPGRLLAEGRSRDFRENFCGTHFFNPPRYLRLLEIIPAPDTLPAVIDFLNHYGDLYLGKRTVVCKDTPGFIANRIGVFGVIHTLKVMKDLRLGIDEIDKLTGTIAGRPKSATFRTSDIVGLDTFIRVTTNLYASLPDDPEQEAFKLPELIIELEKRNWLGDKTGQGFYKKVKNKKGASEILTLDLNDFEYKPRNKVRFQTLGTARSIDTLKERLPVLYHGRDKAGEFYRRTLNELFRYASQCVPGVSEAIYKIDEATKAGFGWEYGPFETCDIIGVGEITEGLKSTGSESARWVSEMLSQGLRNFYITENGIKKYYDVASGNYLPVPGKQGAIVLDHLHENHLLWGNSGCSVIDLGDGILNIEFHTKMNTMGAEVIEGINKGIELAEKDFRGVVIGNDGQNFTAGANLGILFMLAIEQDYIGLNLAIQTFQNTMRRIRYSGIPVVVAPHGLSLGGGCEMSLHSDHVQAAAETYIGLVEVGVGLVPSGGGTKEMTKRVSEHFEPGDIEFNILQNIFMNIGTGKVATSALEAVDMKYLRESDGISINPDRLISDAKSEAIRLANAGYSMPDPTRKIRVLGRSALALFKAGIQGMRTGNFITDHDVKIAEKIAWIMCGGDLSAPTEVSEQYLLDLEREAFMSLCGERKTLERIEAILQGRKPLRN